MSQYQYLCAECNHPATKPAVSKYDKLAKTGGTLGSWACKNCNKKHVKVRRKKVNEQEGSKG